MSATPLIALHFAMLIAFQLPYYASDMKCSHRNLLVRLGWPMVMRLHDLAILFAAMSIIAAFFLGLPARAALNTLIALPLALAQIWQMERIRQGYPPRWRILTYSALAFFALTAYLIMLGFLVI